MAFLSLRRPGFRYSPLGIFLVVAVFLLLLSFYNIRGFNWTPNEFWEESAESDVQLLPDNAAQATVTVTAVATSTIVVETVRQPPPTPKVPGPAFCEVCGPDDSLCNLYGEQNLARSRVYEGANLRFRRVVADALAGKPIKIGVLGGSVTKGHGIRSTENWTTLLLDTWKTLFPKSKTTLINGAVPATGSDYLSMCFGQHIDEDVDLVIIELLINDQRLESNAVAYEWLLRGLLALPKSPAVINLHTIGLSFEFITTGGDLHTPVSEYYDVPVVSVRNMLAPHIFQDAKLDEYYFTKLQNGKPDLRHVGANGHKVMADVLVAYTQRQICAVEKEKAKPKKHSSKPTLPGIEGLDAIPRLRLFQKYDHETLIGQVKPSCLSIRSDAHPLVPLEAKGWEKWIYKDQTDKPYLVAREPGSIIKFEVIVGVMGRVRITYLRSKTFGLGTVFCWLDDDRQEGTNVEGWWKVEKINIARTTPITETASPGKHILSCEVLKVTSDPGGGHEFRLIAVDAS